ncbi:CDF family Co(II)/Ni(II) efflux transporter DmeF [Siccirubricoccus phaeus]|uniref:CDF family Co(II)/Ni(II) efflux transporter DmeF n=1 Tax=Siccirubricoccus phaeus TaxID=2595053 RepID=UPI0011F177F2|nr:CDF family Co(II)/Ni(II) efflux transporter DmeF [Siccirubricoccus phaeus]
MHSHSPEAYAYDHSFGQDARRPQERGVVLVAWVTVAAMVVEVAAGLATGSVALLADGAHMGTHAAALGAVALAYRFARARAGDARFAWGTGKANALAAFGAAVMLGVVALGVAGEAVERLFAPAPIAFGPALWVATFGLLVNLGCAWLLHAGGEHAHHEHEPHNHGHGHGDHAHRAALLHVLADAATSVAAIVALWAAWGTGLFWLDPLIGLAGAGLVARWGWSLARDSAGTLLDREAPAPLRDAARTALEADGDARVADLHLWSVGPGAWTLVASVVAHDPREPEVYKARLPGHIAIHHPIVEVRRCA